jgi:hypothetical protein
MSPQPVSRPLTHPARGAHVLQLYDDDARLLRSLEWWVLSGIDHDGAVVLVASEAHLAELQRRLGHQGLDLARGEGRVVVVEAGEMLDRFMVHGWPNTKLFDAAITACVDRVRRDRPDRPVRAFGEMVAVLMARGNPEATLRLEQLWAALLEREGIALFCAYPRSVFEAVPATLRLVCEAHSHVIPA